MIISISFQFFNGALINLSSSSPTNCPLHYVIAIFQLKSKAIYKLGFVILSGKEVTFHNKLTVKEQLFFFILINTALNIE
jgi:hypothetical protein